MVNKYRQRLVPVSLLVAAGLMLVVGNVDSFT